LAQRTKKPALFLWAHYTSGLTALHIGDFLSAHEHFEKGISLYDAQKRHSRHALQDPGVACLAYMTVAKWLLGYPDQALRIGREAVALAEELSHPFSLTFSLNITALVCQLCGEVEEARNRAETGHKICSDLGGVPFWEAWGPILTGWTLAEKGQQNDGLSLMVQGIADFAATGAKLVQPYFYLLLAEAYRYAGQPIEGLSALDTGLSVVDRTKERWCEAELHRLKGELLLMASLENDKTAEACFRKSLEISRQQSAKSWELRAVTSLSCLWQKQGKTKEARQELETVYDWFTEGFSTGDLKRAREQLGRLV
jgi:predicted ATPase